MRYSQRPREEKKADKGRGKKRRDCGRDPVANYRYFVQLQGVASVGFLLPAVIASAATHHCTARRGLRPGQQGSGRLTERRLGIRDLLIFSIALFGVRRLIKSAELIGSYA